MLPDNFDALNACFVQVEVPLCLQVTIRDDDVEKMFMNDSRTIAQDAVVSLWCSECNAEYAFSA